MMRDMQFRQGNSTKRKRIPRDPNIMQGYPNKKEEVPIPGDLYKKRTDDIDPATLQQNRNQTRSEEIFKNKVLAG